MQQGQVVKVFSTFKATTLHVPWRDSVSGQLLESPLWRAETIPLEVVRII
jgi:hypothetical protein